MFGFPGGPLTKTPCSQCRGLGLIPGQGTRSHIPQRVCMLQLKISVTVTSKNFRSKPERKTPIQYTNAYIWNLERW